MTKQEWLAAGVVALVVAVLTTALTALPSCWAEEKQLAPVPALPSTKLTIPTINAQVTASATPAPGQGVKVDLALQMPSGSDVKEVPVTVTVRSTTMNPMARSMPKPQQVAKVDVMLPVGPDGKGSAVIDLPLVWAVPPPPPAADTTQGEKPKEVVSLKAVTRYQMALSSALGGNAAPANIENVPILNGTQEVKPAPAPPAAPPAAAPNTEQPKGVQESSLRFNDNFGNVALSSQGPAFDMAYLRGLILPAVGLDS